MRYHASHTAEPGKQREREEKRGEVGDKGKNAYRENIHSEYKGKKKGAVYKLLQFKLQ